MRIIFKTSYNQDINLFKHGGYVFWYSLLMLVVLFAPLFLKDFYIGEIALVFIYAIAGLGLMVMVGFTGLPSLGHAAFMAIGAYTNAIFNAKGVPFFICLPLAGALAAGIGAMVAVPLKRMTGIYFAIATLAFAIIVEEVIAHWKTLTGGVGGIGISPPLLGGEYLSSPLAFYFICLGVLLIVLWLTLNILRSPSGRAFIAIRDSEISAQSMGIHVAWFKILAFAISGGITGLAGALFSHKLMYMTPDVFNFLLSVQLLMMVVVGGLGTVHGAIYGAIFIGLLPQAIAIARDYLPPAIGEFPGMEPGIFGLILLLFILFEPMGLYGRWMKIKLYFDMFPLYRKATFKKQKNYLKTERVR